MKTLPTRKVLACAAMALTLGFTAPAYASTAPNAADGTAAVQKVSTPEGKKLVELVKTEVQKNDSIKLNTSSSNLDWDNASAVSVDGENVVSIPLKNEGTVWSNLSIQIDSNNKVGNYTEGHFKEISKESGHVTVFQNGKMTSDKVANSSEAPRASDGATTYGVGDAIGELNSCLSAAGIPAWVVAGATAACSAAGGWAGILACYTAAGVAGGTVGYCSGKAAKKL